MDDEFQMIYSPDFFRIIKIAKKPADYKSSSSLNMKITQHEIKKAARHWWQATFAVK
jgi:hypothetical protein